MPYTSFQSGQPGAGDHIVSLDIPDGVVGTPYDYQNDIAPPSVEAPITYSISSGSLPPGLSLSSPDSSREWRISGTPTTAGSYTFTLKAQNSIGFAHNHHRRWGRHELCVHKLKHARGSSSQSSCLVLGCSHLLWAVCWQRPSESNKRSVHLHWRKPNSRLRKWLCSRKCARANSCACRRGRQRCTRNCWPANATKKSLASSTSRCEP